MRTLPVDEKNEQERKNEKLRDEQKE